MDLNRAERIAIDLMLHHGLSYWGFKFDNPLRRLGMCSHKQRIISLGRHATTVNSEEQVVNTILHEIAHALVGGKHNHDGVWQAKCLEIGGDGQRCSDITLKATPKYKISCGTCYDVFSYYRRPKFLSHLSEAWCQKCGKDKSKGKLVTL